MAGKPRALVPVFGIAALLFLAPAPAEAQITGTIDYDISIDSSYFDDCDPGTVCLVVWCGVFDGNLSLEYTGFDGTYDRYDVTATFNMHINLCPATPLDPTTVYDGVGEFIITRDVVPQQQMTLDITRPTGPPITIDSGLITPAVPFPSFVDFEMVSIPTSETFTLQAEPTTPPIVQFIRGDANTDTVIDIADAVTTLASLFDPSADPLRCDKAGDANDDGAVDISDPIFTLALLFTAGSPPPSAPYPDCGEDPTADSLSCDQFDLCID